MAEGTNSNISPKLGARSNSSPPLERNMGDTWIAPPLVKKIDENPGPSDKVTKVTLHDQILGLLQTFFTDFEKFVEENFPNVKVELKDNSLEIIGTLESDLKGEHYLSAFIESQKLKKACFLKSTRTIAQMTKTVPKQYVNDVLQIEGIKCFWSKSPNEPEQIEVYTRNQEHISQVERIMNQCIFKLALIQKLSQPFRTFMKEAHPDIELIPADGCPGIKGDDGSVLMHQYIEQFYEEKLFTIIHKFTSSSHVDFVRRPTPREYISQKLLSQKVDDYFYSSCSETEIRVCALTEKDVQSVVKAISESVVDFTKTVNSPSQKNKLDSLLGSNTVQKYKKKYVVNTTAGDDENFHTYKFIVLDDVKDALYNLVTRTLASSTTPGRSYPFTKRILTTNLELPHLECQVQCTPGFICGKKSSLKDKYIFTFLQENEKRITVQQGCIADSEAQLIMCPVKTNLEPFGVGLKIFEKGDKDELQQGLSEISVQGLQKKKFLPSKRTGGMSAYAMAYVVLPDENKAITKYLQTKLPFIEKMLEHAKEHDYHSIALCVDFMVTNNKDLLESLATAFIKSITCSNFLPITSFVFKSSNTKNVREIHLICENPTLAKCLEAKLSMFSKKYGNHCQLLNMMDSGISLDDEQCLVSPIDIELYKGSMIDDALLKKTDMLVNSTDPSCRFDTGFVNRKIFEAAGKEIQDELKKQSSVYPPLRPGEVMVTSGGKLPCKKICHGLIYQWWELKNDVSLKVLRSVMIRSLKAADQHDCAHITFPALGTGTLRYPWKQVGQAMFECVEHYGKSHPNTKVKKVTFVMFPSDEPTQTALLQEHDRWKQNESCVNFRTLDGITESDKVQILESWDPRRLCCFKVISEQLTGVCFPVDIVIAFRDSDGFEDSTDHSKLQLGIQESWKFNKENNHWEGLISFDKGNKTPKDLLQNAIKNCVQIIDNQRFTSLAIKVEKKQSSTVYSRQTSSDNEAIACQIVILSNLVSENLQKLKISVPVYFLVDHSTNLTHVLGLLDFKERSRIWRLKFCRMGDYLRPAKEVILRAESKEKLQADVDQLQSGMNITPNSPQVEDSATAFESQIPSRLSGSHDPQAQVASHDQLHILCYEGDQQGVRDMLRTIKGNEINTVDKDGDTPVHCCVHGCVHGNQTEILEILLAQQNVKLDIRNKANQTALDLAMEEDFEECARLLVQGGCDVNLKNKDGNTAIHEAIATKSSGILQAVLSAPQADFRAQDNNGLNTVFWATMSNSTEAVDLMLERDPDLVNIQTDDGYTPVHAAASNNFMEVASILLMKGTVDYSLVDNEDKSPLHIAVCMGFESMLDLLVFKGYSINAQDKDGNTPLHIAQQRIQPQLQADRIQSIKKRSRRDTFSFQNEQWQQYDSEGRALIRNGASIIFRLVELKADIFKKNKAGESPLDSSKDPVVQQFMIKLSETARTHSQARSGGGITLPSHWIPMEGEPYKKVQLRPDVLGLEQMEYNDIKCLFSQSLPKAKVISIQRVQNPYLWEFYTLCKRRMEKRYGKFCANEKKLFHGTLYNRIDKICSENLDFRLASERTGALLGHGSYFALEAKTADLYSTTRKDDHKFLIVMSVLVGKICKGNSSYSRPPPINTEDPDSELFDTCVDTADAPKVYCVFDMNQYCPDYVVEYQTFNL